MRPVFIAFLTTLVLGSSANVVKAQIVISEVYGGGGNTGAPYNEDFVELYNNGSSSVSLNGYTLQYASATGTFNGASTTNTTTLSGTLDPGKIALVRLAFGANTSAASLPSAGTGNLQLTFDNTNNAVSATAGKFALANNSTTVTSPTSSNVVDFVGFGGTANQSEGTGPALGASNTSSVNRLINSDGSLQDTNNNSTDFVAGSPNPGVLAVPEPGSLLLVSASCLTAFAINRFRRQSKLVAV